MVSPWRMVNLFYKRNDSFNQKSVILKVGLSKFIILMKNINIPPYITLIAGVILIAIARTILNTQAVIPQFIQFLGFILVVIGIAGFIGKLVRKKHQ